MNQPPGPENVFLKIIYLRVIQEVVLHVDVRNIHYIALLLNGFEMLTADKPLGILYIQMRLKIKYLYSY